MEIENLVGWIWVGGVFILAISALVFTIVDAVRGSGDE